MLKIKRILAPIDLSSRSGPAVEHAVNIAKHFESEIIFLHVVPPVTYNAALASGYPGGIMPSQESDEQLAGLLDEFLERTAPGVSGERIMEKGEPSTVIEQIAKDRDVDLIVMPTSGAGAFRRLLIGSVTAKVLHDVECAVLTGVHVEPLSPFTTHPYRKVGCAIGLQEGSSELLKRAIEFAAHYDGEVTVLHAIESGESVTKAASGTGIEERAQEATAALGREAGLETQPVVKFGAPEDVIPEAAKELGLDLLVIGRRQGEELHVNAYGLVRNSPCPVLSL